MEAARERRAKIARRGREGPPPAGAPARKRRAGESGKNAPPARQGRNGKGRDGKGEGSGMNDRETRLASIRRSLGVNGREAPRRTAVNDRIANHPRGIVPKRGDLPSKGRAELFRQMIEATHATVE